MKVSVWMTAYNHGKYISQCLDSVLNQKTNFEFDIVIGEDCSTDDTREIVKKYSENNPGKFRLFLPEKNIGMMEMDVATRKMCTGEYIALLNGDDYWTDENKLQIQIDFMEQNPDAVMCFHKAEIINENTGYKFDSYYPGTCDTLPVESLLLGYNPVMTPTVMIRNIMDLPDYYAELPYGDMPLYLLLSEKGKIKYIDRKMSVYRIHSDGQWQGESVYKNLLKDLNFYRIMNGKLGFKYDRQIRKIYSQRYFDLVISDINNDNYKQAKRFFKKLVLEDREFLAENKREILYMYEILFENADKSRHGSLLNREVQWKINQPESIN